MTNVRSIAKRAGVSITTVSRVLNNHPQVSNDVRQRILAATNEAGYTPTVGRRSTSNIAFVYTDESSLGSHFDAALMSGIQAGLHDHGFDLMVLEAARARSASETFTQLFMRKGVRGAILRTNTPTRSVVELIAAEGFPAVVAAERFDDPRVNYVFSDSRRSSCEAVEHLIALGHRRIAVCVNIIENSDHQDRLSAYRQVMLEHNLPVEDRMILRVPANRQGSAQVLRRLMTMPDRPTAVFLTDPATAAGTLGEARKMGVAIPDELSIVGFDDTDVRSMVSPELTAVCQDAFLLGQEAFNALRTVMDSEEKMVIQRSLPTWLEIHDSTGPAKLAVS